MSSGWEGGGELQEKGAASRGTWAILEGENRSPIINDIFRDLILITVWAFHQPLNLRTAERAPVYRFAHEIGQQPKRLML